MDKQLFDDIEDYLKNTEIEHPGLLEDSEIETLILSLAEHRQDKGFTEDEAIGLVRWAERQIIGQNLLGLLLRGYIWIDDEKGTFKDDDIVIGLTETGRLSQES